MENTGLLIQKENHRKKDSLHRLCNDKELSDEDSSKSQLKKLIKRSNSHRALVVNAIQSQISKVFFKDLFFGRVHGLDNRIPKHMVSVDEKYLRRCLEFVHNSALKAAQCSIPVSLRATNMGTLSETLNTAEFFGGMPCGSGQFVFECPITAETGRVFISANGGEEWTLGSVMGSKSMINILNSDLLQHFGASDRNDNLNRMNFSDAKGMICYDFMDSPSSLSISSSHKLEKETPLVQSHKYGPISVHKRLASTSSTASTCSDWLSSASSTPSQGMIQCTWKRGIPHFVFSADDQKEVYVANLRKVDSSDDKALDYVYQFHLNKGGQKSRHIPESDLQLVGKMHVSTSFTLCQNNCRIMEREFTLFSNIEIYDKEMYTSEHPHRKNKGLSKKVSQVFRTSPSSKRRTLSRFGGSSSIEESCPWDPHAVGRTNLLETNNVPPNFEMAAIVVKDHLPCNRADKVGGWGLKFLHKSGSNQFTLPSESCNRNNGDCSTSMSILIPAGLHGGPRIRNGGPSSLIDRWRSGGHCDCGGWDEGCPLTVLQRRSSKGEVLSQVDTQECKSVDLVTQGSSNFSSTLRMVNVHDGLYFIHFHPALSALQSFSIAVAIIHAQSPSLRPNSAQELS
ncbi:uncharacterized protein LOC133301189 [Gastrolobium bilobum]|uniref:uncharacterized protein LOC133301189 n=1 Tax=Gastrolobium bilobum TaxID=150636 RepID=UPI002AAFC1FE|nr:uncharacterized protein LOC133301189 [Gastrolobium bilobum]